MYGHPAATRASLVQTAQDMASSVGSPSAHLARKSSVSCTHASSGRLAEPNSTEETPLLDERLEAEHYNTSSTVSIPATSNTHGHSHAGSMNMRALVLHVLGDALGNVGVIATGLVIWLTTWQYKYYFDPIISLVITVIIFSSALPLGELVVVDIFTSSPNNNASSQCIIYLVAGRPAQHLT